MVSKKNVRAYLTEFIGTFFVVFVTCWSFTSLELGQIGYLSLGIANAVIMAACVWVGVNNSGAHFNPVVSLVNWYIIGMDARKAFMYIFVQLLGSMLAALLVIMFIPSDLQQNLETFIGFPKFSVIISDFQAFVIEFILSMFYIFVYFATVVDKRAPKSVFGFALGAVILMGSISVGAYTNACINPARIFGPYLLIGRTANAMVYWTANISGGIFAGFYYNFFLLRNAEFDGFEDNLEKKDNMMNMENIHEAMNLKY